jgi:hypothetical protein
MNKFLKFCDEQRTKMTNNLAYPWFFLFSSFFVDSSMVCPKTMKVDNVWMIDVRQHFEYILQLVLLF